MGDLNSVDSNCDASIVINWGEGGTVEYGLRCLLDYGNSVPDSGQHLFAVRRAGESGAPDEQARARVSCCCFFLNWRVFRKLKFFH